MQTIRDVILTLLTRAAQAIVRRHRPTVIAVTGSIAKTTTVAAIAHILRTAVTVRAPRKNYNTLIGVPLTIIDAPAPGRNPLRWIHVLYRVIVSFVWPRYPRVLVLEMGIDHAGEMVQLTRVAPPDIAVVTYVASVHAQKIGTLDDIAREKAQLVAALSPTGTAVLNADDARVAAMPTDARRIFFGTVDGAPCDVCVRSVRSDAEHVTFTVCTAAECATAQCRLLRAPHLVPSLAAAIAAAHAYGISLADAVRALEDFHVPAQRFERVRCGGGVTVIDDSYNAAPPSMRAALQAFHAMPVSGRRIVIVGAMRELGEYEAQEHAAMARFIGTLNVDEVVLVGAPFAQHVASVGAASGSVGHVSYCDTTDDVLAYLPQIVRDGDTVFLKGSNYYALWRVRDALCAGRSSCAKRRN